VIGRLRRGAARALDRRFEPLAGRLDRLEAMLASQQAALDRIAPLLGTLAVDDPGHRRRLEALRDDPGYAAPWEEPDPLVTIAIPTRDRPELLAERALASALAQTHERIEVIVVGDAAGPETEAAVAAAGDARVRFANLTQRFERPADGSHWLTAATLTRNLAYRQAQGHWLLDLDDDDALRPDAVERLLAHAREHRVEVAYGVLESHMPDGSTMLVGGFPPEHTRFGWQGGIVHSGLRFFAREHIAADLGLPGDWFRMYRMIRAGVRIAHLDEVTCDYYPSAAWGLKR
jgi:glycosyltransferase involved in cell wall biosynthesis